MAPRLSGQSFIFGVVFFVFKSLLGIKGQMKLSKEMTIFSRKPRSHVRILIYRTWAILQPCRMGYLELGPWFLTRFPADFLTHGVYSGKFFFCFFWPPSDSSICVNCRCLLFYAKYFNLVLGCSFLLMSRTARWS